MRKKLLLLLIGGGVSIAGIVFFFLILQKNQGSYLPQQKSHELPLIKASGVKFVGWDDRGRVSWVLSAEEAVEFERYTVLKKVKVKLFEKGDPVSEGVAGEVRIENSNLLLKDKICIISFKEKAELRTSELIWSGSEKRLYTEKQVTVKKGGFIIKGKGLIGKPDLSLVIIKNQVTTYFEGGS
ncbi:LPS export ABC transporter periplasmic protein LptC [Candidatus Aerophobetes bacterium]|nr:LPS export ABC transporter periplasmic protein LptC [Candidatus Aerophobetes bacterium]